MSTKERQHMVADMIFASLCAKEYDQLVFTGKAADENEFLRMREEADAIAEIDADNRSKN